METGSETNSDSLIYSVPPLDLVKCPPAIVFLGEKDALVPVSTAQRFQQKMKEAGVLSELHLYPDQQHGFFNESKGGTQIFLDTIRKLDQFLAGIAFLKGTPSEVQIASDSRPTNLK